MNILPLPQKNDASAETGPKTEALPGRWHVLAPVIALLGGVFGIPGAIYNELLHGSLLVVFIGAPIIEEILKPTGVYILLAKWPRALRSQLYTAFLTALGGIAFALIENLIYLQIYFPGHSARLVLWRYTVNLSVHALGSFIFGLGINQELLKGVTGERKLLSSGKRFFLTAIILHSLYNILMAVFAGQLGFTD